ncbi:unnamed protein product [Porites evermanni]|uniref:EGF-like domain-containing protein n=1 Tax=Porites evermanni TaxID=104178 RepID=A0ABN8MAI8_9CNID|nr:unnamed protein product [Porites evermanni]
MASTLRMRTTMSPNKGETAVHGCHCRGDMVVLMRKVLAITRSWYTDGKVPSQQGAPTTYNLAYWKFPSRYECKTGLHNCHDDAYCTNTKGSFTCTCKQGYSGDGVNCTGSKPYGA